MYQTFSAGRLVVLLFSCACVGQAFAQTDSPVFVWPDLAPGETSSETGELLPFRDSEQPPISRVVNVRRPSIDVFLPEQPNGTGILVLPGGGFGKIVPDMEGSEVAPRLNDLGIAVFVLRYRTSEGKPADEPAWRRPLQDAQRAMRLIRAHAADWQLNEDHIGQLAFSAGGQVGAILHTTKSDAYDPIDEIDERSYRPNFSLLIYPWRVLDETTGKLLPEIQVAKDSSPAFIVHTSDDRSTSVGSALIYIGLKQNGVPSELHIYENGGHGYGTRPRPNSNIGTWPDRAVDWLVRRGLGKPAG